MTFFYKRVFPVIWFGFIAVFVAVPFLRTGIAGSVSRLNATSLIAPVFVAMFGYFIMKKRVFDLVDEVFDDGDALVIRNGGTEDRAALADIINVSYSQLSNPPRVTLSLRNPGQFGDRVSFFAPVSVNPLRMFFTNPTIDELIKRIDAARRRGRR
jgi:hypothetical protein